MKNIFSKIFGALKRLFSAANLAKANAIAERIKALLDYALPAAQVIATLTPTRSDDEIIALIQRFKLRTPVPVSGASFDKVTVQGILMNAAGVLLRENLTAALKSAGSEGLKVGEGYITSHTQIPDSIVNAATNSAYALLKGTQE